MKTIKSILIATTLVCATAVSSLSAQQAAQPAKEHQWKVAVGDSVMIKRECVEYLTGERPSVWVWDKVHTVRQLGTKRFPEGVLLMNIYSWICEECLIPVTHNEQEVAEQPKEEPKEEPKAQPVEQPKEEPKAEPVKEKPVVAPVVEPVKEEPKAEPKAEPVEEPKEETPVEAKKEEKTAQTNQGDSIHSKQDFKHHYDRFTIGLRGGAAGLLHKTKEGNWTCGGDVVLDLQYAHYWTKDGRPVDLGIITGVGLGYAQSSVKSSVNSTRPGVEDLDAANPMHIDYTIRADEVKEHDGQLQLEVPLMFSLIHQNGLFFNVGPKFMLPVFTPYKQTISNNPNTFVEAYYQETGVRVTNDVITGLLAEDKYTSKGTDYKNKFTINVMLTAEIGYEWILKSGNSLGLGAYANYSVYNSFKNNPEDPATDPLIRVESAPSNTSNAVINVNPLTGTYASGLGFFDAGVKLAYHFNFPKKRQNNDSKLF
ncbi:MAG: hypothetical protein IJQ18_01745 [Paludibacteraceae bacterium]|nr:hypothetical protein [Paludibacteraceae bacterium]